MDDSVGQYFSTYTTPSWDSTENLVEAPLPDDWREDEGLGSLIKNKQKLETLAQNDEGTEESGKDQGGSEEKEGDAV